MKKIKEVWWLEQSIEVSNEMVEFRVEGVFNNERGTFEVKRRRTTKQVSNNPEMNTAIMSRLNQMEAEMLQKMQELRNAWNLENGEGDDDEVLQRNFAPSGNDDQTDEILKGYGHSGYADGEQAGDDEGNFSMDFDEDTGDIPERPKRGKK